MWVPVAVRLVANCYTPFTLLYFYFTEWHTWAVQKRKNRSVCRLWLWGPKNRALDGGPGGVCANVKFNTKRAALVLFCAVLTAHLCSYNIQQCDASLRTPLRELTALPQASWLDFGEWKGRGKLDRKRRDRKGWGGKENEKEVKGKKRGKKEKGTKGREGGWMERERKVKREGGEREEYLQLWLQMEKHRGPDHPALGKGHF